MNQRFKTSMAAVALAAVLFGCGGSKPENQEMEEGEEVGITNILEKAGDMAKAAEQSQKDANKKMEERIKRGDTLAIPYSELAKFLPDEIDGYKSEEEASGETTNTLGMSVSVVRKKFVKGEDYVNIELSDYNGGANTASQGALAMFSMAAEISMENSDMKQTGFRQGNDIKGTLIYQKSRQVAELSAVIGGRFLVKMEANNQKDAEKLKEYFQKIALNELASH
jgi:hypothetical protein